MFIRRVRTRSRPDSSQPYFSFRLVQSERAGNFVRQLTLLNLGSAFPVPPQQWPALVQLLETLHSGQTPLFDPDPALLAVAENLAERLRQRGFATEDDAGRDLASVHLDSLDHSRVRSVGGERLALDALQTLGFQDALRAQGASPRDAKIATALLLARMLHPSSEREAHAWLCSTSASLELLGLEAGLPLSLHKLYRIGDLLWRQREALETALFQRERSLLDLPDMVVFYDLTNVHYHGRPRGDLQHGRSKQKRHDCPLVTLGLTLDAEGFPRRSEILPGNVSEPGTLAEAIRRLERLPLQAGVRPTVVMDAGLSTKQTIAWLQQRGYAWITVRRGTGAPPESAPQLTFRTRHGQQAKVWSLEREGDESLLCIWSEERQQKDDAILAKQRERFEGELQALHEGLSRPRCTKRYENVNERLGRLKERYKRVSGQYDITVEKAAPAPESKGAKKKGAHKQPTRASAVTWQRNRKHAGSDAKAGTYVLRTSHADWDLERIVQTYWKLTELEATFRSLKAEIGLRPIWHSKASRIRAHLFLAVLAYHGVHLLRRRLAAHGYHDSWATIRRKLAGWVRLTTTLRTASGEHIVCRQDTRAEAEAAALAQAAGVEPGLHRVRTRTTRTTRS